MVWGYTGECATARALNSLRPQIAGDPGNPLHMKTVANNWNPNQITELAYRAAINRASQWGQPGYLRQNGYSNGLFNIMTGAAEVVGGVGVGAAGGPAGIGAGAYMIAAGSSRIGGGFWQMVDEFEGGTTRTKISPWVTGSVVPLRIALARSCSGRRWTWERWWRR